MSSSSSEKFGWFLRQSSDKTVLRDKCEPNADGREATGRPMDDDRAFSQAVNEVFDRRCYQTSASSTSRIAQDAGLDAALNNTYAASARLLLLLNTLAPTARISTLPKSISVPRRRPPLPSTHANVVHFLITASDSFHSHD